MSTLLTRRHVLTVGGQIACGAALSMSIGSMLVPSPTRAAQLGELQPADVNGLRIPEGFQSRVVAQSLLPVATESSDFLDYTWHILPDGGATFAQNDGGWIYVSNSESLPGLGGGASALRFDAAGGITSAYRILRSHRRCFGKKMPRAGSIQARSGGGGPGLSPSVPDRRRIRRAPVSLLTHEKRSARPATGFTSRRNAARTATDSRLASRTKCAARFRNSWLEHHSFGCSNDLFDVVRLLHHQAPGLAVPALGALGEGDHLPCRDIPASHLFLSGKPGNDRAHGTRGGRAAGSRNSHPRHIEQKNPVNGKSIGVAGLRDRQFERGAGD